MSTPFLLAFSHTVVAALIQRDRLVVATGSSAEDVVRELAAYLATRQGHSVISSTSRGLLASGHVDELFADDDEIKDIVDELGAT